MEVYCRKCQGFWASVSLEKSQVGYAWVLELVSTERDSPGLPVLQMSGYADRAQAISAAVSAIELLNDAGDADAMLGLLDSAESLGRQH